MCDVATAPGGVPSRPGIPHGSVPKNEISAFFPAFLFFLAGETRCLHARKTLSCVGFGKGTAENRPTHYFPTASGKHERLGGETRTLSLASVDDSYDSTPRASRVRRDEDGLVSLALRQTKLRSTYKESKPLL